MNILESIIKERRADVVALKRNISEKQLLEQVAERIHYRLADHLKTVSGPGIIAEVKKASPSAGVLRNEYEPGLIAAEYRDAGACGISVLTEPNHFMGSGKHLEDVRAVVDLPVLRKDFICDSYQIVEALAWGGDVILLIVAALEWPELVSLYEESKERGLEVLVESHSASELEKALTLPEAIIGINSRDLTTLKTDLSTAVLLADLIPSDRISIAESGINSREDVALLVDVGYDGLLIGESLLKCESPGAALKGLL